MVSVCQDNTVSSALGWCLPIECLAGSSIEFGGDRIELVLGAVCEPGLAREVLAQEAVGVLIGAALPGATRIAEEDGDATGDGEL